MPSSAERRHPRSVPIPTGWAALVIALVAIPLGISRAENWMIVPVALGAVLVLIIIDFFAAPSPRGIDVEREFPTSLALGERSDLRWLVKNRTGRTVRLTVADALWPSFDASRRSSRFTLAANKQHRFGAVIEPQRRGRFPLGAVTLRTIGPFRLVHRQQTRTVPGTLAVLPAYPSRDLMRTRMRIPLETGIRSVRTRGTGTDFDQLREYQPGDDIRRVDWAATARQQKAIVRDYRAERNQHVVAMLDNGRLMAGTVGEAPRVEHAMDAVLGLTQVAAQIGDNVGLVTFDNQVRGIVPASNSKAQFARITEAMYLLDPQYDESAYGVAFTTAASRFRRRALFVVFTDLVESVVVDSLLPAMRALTKTHLVMVAAVRDPDVAGWANDKNHADASDAFRSAAAVASLNARDRTIAQLTAVGAIVVDAKPGELATGVVDQYLALKAQGRL
jgi:uncharacterized protein (DUF58 family)